MKKFLVSILFVLFVFTGLFADAAVFYNPLAHYVANAKNIAFEGEINPNTTFSLYYADTGITAPEYDDVWVIFSEQYIGVNRYFNKAFQGPYLGPQLILTTGSITGKSNSFYDFSNVTLAVEGGYALRSGKLCLTPFAKVGYIFTHNFYGQLQEFGSGEVDKLELVDFSFNYGLKIGVVF